MRKTVIGLLLGGLVLTACRANEGPGPSGGISREQFIELYVALRNAQLNAKTPAEFESTKQQIFARAGVPPESLSRFAAEHGGEITYMATIWDSIKVRLDVELGAIPK
jgi:hypothetical protein